MGLVKSSSLLLLGVVVMQAASMTESSAKMGTCLAIPRAMAGAIAYFFLPGIAQEFLGIPHDSKLLLALIQAVRFLSIIAILRFIFGPVHTNARK